MIPAIKTSGLTKIYGEKRALDEVNLEVEEGSIFGFLGPNGAGKTTMLRLVTGLARPTHGSVEIFGQDVATATSDIRAMMGFLPDVPGFYEWMSAEQFLHFVGGIFEIEKSVLDIRVQKLLGLAGLGEVTTKIGGYSRGMKQRLGIAQALINAPRLLLLDEPTSALDPIGRKDILDMLVTMRGRATVFFSTHILADVERVCDSVAILDGGRTIAQGSISELKARYGKEKVILEVTDASEDLSKDIARQNWAASVIRGSSGALEITVTDLLAAQHDIPKIVAARGVGLSRMESGEMGLEEVFVDIVGGVRR